MRSRLGAVAFSDPARPVAWLARDLGMHRQGVQRITNDLLGLGLVELKRNPHHQRAMLVELTDRGRQTFEATREISQPWVKTLVEGLPASDLAAALRVASAMRNRLRDRRDDGAGAE